MCFFPLYVKIKRNRSYGYAFFSPKEKIHYFCYGQIQIKNGITGINTEEQEYLDIVDHFF